MVMVRKISLLSFSLLVLLSAQTIFAAVLPNSSHYEGTSHYSVSGLKGDIDFAVYDTQGHNGDEFAASIGDTAPGSGRYIYAYQIFSSSTSTTVVDYFAVLGLDGKAFAGISDPSANIGTVSDSPSDPAEAGVDATRSYFDPSRIKGIWKFNYNGSHIQPTEHSVFLVLRSNSDWTVGTYEFTPSTSDEFPVPPDTSIPEPFTFALLGSAGLAVLNRRKK
jgi:hypothetical protein